MSIDFDQLILEVAERFKAHNMNDHLTSLRAFFRDRRKRQSASARQKRIPWDEQMVLRWAALWRIPPLENVYPQLRSGMSCRCGTDWKHGGGVFVETVFPEGRVLQCRDCKLEWLVLDNSKV